MKLVPCIRCQLPFAAADLLTKQIRWRKSGPTGAVIRSKNIGRYCPSCVSQDEQYVQLKELK